MNNALFICFSILCLVFGLTGNAFSFVVEVSGLKNHAGQLCYSVFKNGEDFPDNPNGAIKAGCIDVKPTFEIDLTEKAFASDRVALALFHDENADAELNLVSFFGIPKEGFGFSNNPQIWSGPPSFGESSIKKNEEKIAIVMNYFY